MLQNDATLHLLAGKIASGKSTLAAELGRVPRSVVISEDAWLVALFGAEMRSVDDYVRYSARLRAAIAPHVIALLRSGLSVILDFPANTPAVRSWMRELFEQADCAHRLHFLDVPDDVCRARLQRRNSQGGHAFTVSTEEFDRITSHFVAPSKDEGLNVLIHRPAPVDRSKP